VRLTTVILNYKKYLEQKKLCLLPIAIQKHILVYTIVIAITLTVFFDLTHIASSVVILILIFTGEKWFIKISK